MAEVCRFYGWTVEYALNLNSRIFFDMLQEARRVTALEWMDRCTVQAIAIQDADYCNKLIERFKSLIPITADEFVRMHEEEERSYVRGPGAGQKLAEFFQGGGSR